MARHVSARRELRATRARVPIARSGRGPVPDVLGCHPCDSHCWCCGPVGAPESCCETQCPYGAARSLAAAQGARVQGQADGAGIRVAPGDTRGFDCKGGDLHCSDIGGGAKFCYCRWCSQHGVPGGPHGPLCVTYPPTVESAGSGRSLGAASGARVPGLGGSQRRALRSATRGGRAPGLGRLSRAPVTPRGVCGEGMVECGQIDHGDSIEIMCCPTGGGGGGLPSPGAWIRQPIDPGAPSPFG